MSMVSLIKEIGRGKRGAQDLTYDQAREGARMIINGEASDVQIGAFLMAERIKMECTDELLAFIDIYRAKAILHPIADSFDCAGPYDGRHKTFIGTLPTAFVLSSCGLPVTLHGSAALPPKFGITLESLMQVLDVDLESRASLIAAAEASGVLYVPTERWCPPLSDLRHLRVDIGVRTLFNTVEKLLRFSDARYMAFGIFHRNVFEKIGVLLASSNMHRTIIVQGMEGSEDVWINRVTQAMIVTPNEMEMITINPAEYDMLTEWPERQWTSAEQVDTAIAVLQGEADPAFSRIVVFNAAIRLWISNRAESIADGLDQAIAALANGKAWSKFADWHERARKPIES